MTDDPSTIRVPVVDDGWGITEGCTDPRCDIEIVRPGSVQCSNYCGRSSDPVPPPTPSPSTNNGEWVCAHADTEPCGPEDWTDVEAAAGTGCGYVTPSPVPDDHDGYTINLGAPSHPVPDSERPDAILSLAAEVRRVDGNHDLGAAALAESLMPWIDAHRCPTPEGDVLAELRAARAQSNLPGDWPLLAAVDRLLARGVG